MNDIINNNNNNLFDNEFDDILKNYIEEINEFIKKIRILTEISKDFKSININQNIKLLKSNENQFNAFEFFEILDKKLDNTLCDFILLINNIAIDIPKLNKLIINSSFIESLFYIVEFNKGKNLKKKLLYLLDEIYSNSISQKDDIIALIKVIKFKDFISEIILNYKEYDFESVRFALIFVREVLHYLKISDDHYPYCEMKTYFEINNLCVTIDELTLVENEDIINLALLIEKENWSIIDIYNCNNLHMINN